MTHVMVVGEGQTEETFVGSVLAPVLGEREVFLFPRLIPTSKHGRGGALSGGRVVPYLVKTLNERADTFVTTFFDLYGLPSDFPGAEPSRAVPDPLQRAAAVERGLEEAVLAQVGCRPERFIAHVQPYEFEALLFSDTERLVSREPSWRKFAGPLRHARESALSPEHINDGPDTHPSKRLAALRPAYQKTLDGPAVLEAIGLDRIRQECHHFGAWLSRMEALRPF